MLIEMLEMYVVRSLELVYLRTNNKEYENSNIIIELQAI